MMGCNKLEQARISIGKLRTIFETIFTSDLITNSMTRGGEFTSHLGANQLEDVLESVMPVMYTNKEVDVLKIQVNSLERDNRLQRLEHENLRQRFTDMEKDVKEVKEEAARGRAFHTIYEAVVMYEELLWKEGVKRGVLPAQSRKSSLSAICNSTTEESERMQELACDFFNLANEGDLREIAAGVAAIKDLRRPYGHAMNEINWSVPQILEVARRELETCDYKVMKKVMQHLSAIAQTTTQKDQPLLAAINDQLWP